MMQNSSLHHVAVHKGHRKEEEQKAHSAHGVIVSGVDKEADRCCNFYGVCFLPAVCGRQQHAAAAAGWTGKILPPYA